jgi:hypothetical protein
MMRSFRTGCAALLAALAFGGGCAAGAKPHDELGESSFTQMESADVGPVAKPTTLDTGCMAKFGADNLAGFVQEWFDVIAALQLSVDANPVRQFVSDPEGRHMDERLAVQLCSAQILAAFRESRDARIKELANDTAVLLADAANAEKSIAQRFRATDWSAVGSLDAQARRWSEIRPSTRSLSERGAALIERIVPLLREDGRSTYGPGALRISRADREVALRHRGRLTDLTIMVELDIDPGGPLSMTARKVLKWLYHAHGLTYAEPA